MENVEYLAFFFLRHNLLLFSDMGQMLTACLTPAQHQVNFFNNYSLGIYYILVHSKKYKGGKK